MISRLRTFLTPILGVPRAQLQGLSEYRSFPVLNELTNLDKWSTPEWLNLHEELSTYSVAKHCFSKGRDRAYRKGWEWTQAIYGLTLLGAIHRQARGLGVGAGHEPVLFYLADRVAEVTGTDLYGNAQWSAGGGKEADAAILDDAARYCPRAFDRSRLRLLVMDGTALRFPDNAFDFAWSLSSIEHFGSHRAARTSIREMGRVTKAGGFVVVATEFVIGPQGKRHPEYFTRSQFERFVLGASAPLVPIQAMNYTLPAQECLARPIMVGTDEGRRIRPHVVLHDGNVQWTSAIVFFRKLD